MESLQYPNPPPRPLTRKARWRSWNEPAVRAWWLCAVGVLLVALWLLAEQLSEARAARYRIDHWTRIDDARIDQIGDTRRETFHPSVEQLATQLVKISYLDAQGNRHELSGKLTAPHGGDP